MTTSRFYFVSELILWRSRKIGKDFRGLRRLFYSLPWTSVSSWDGLESSCRMSWMWKLVLGILMLSNILQQQRKPIRQTNFQAPFQPTIWYYSSIYIIYLYVYFSSTRARRNHLKKLSGKSKRKREISVRTKDRFVDWFVEEGESETGLGPRIVGSERKAAASREVGHKGRFSTESIQFSEFSCGAAGVKKPAGRLSPD